MIKKATPAAKLTTVKNAINSIKPVRLSERCGVSRAENKTGSGASGSKPLPVVMTYQYTPFMAKIIRAQRAKQTEIRSRARKIVPKKAAKAKAKSATKSARPAGKSSKKSKSSKAMVSKPWTPAEVREVFERFQKANPEPRGELEHLNPFTLLVAVVLSAQATDAGVNRATRELFKVADTP